MLDERLKNVKRPETPDRVQAFFSSVAKRYDVTNSVMSFGLHYGWKRKAVAEARPEAGMKILDICGGTADTSIMMARKVGPTGHVVCSDWNEDMLKVGEFKIEKFGLGDVISTEVADAEELPFEDNSFDRAIVTVASRHLNIDKHFQEMFRVLKPGGRGVCLDFFQPPNRVFRKMYDAYSYTAMPRIAAWVSRDKTGVYDYLPDSIRKYYEPDDFAREMEQSGFRNVAYRALTGGIVYIHSGDKV